MGMKILVTGGAGFIGSNLVKLLIREKSCSVVNVDKLTYAGNLSSLADIASHGRYAFEEVDICDATALEAVFAKHRPQAVMHLAAESHVDRSIDGPMSFMESNISGTYQLLQRSLEYWRNLPAGDCEGINQNSFRFLHVSTDEVYGSLAENEAPFTESSRYDPHSPYSASKAASDHLVRAWCDTYQLPVLVTNCSNNYGPYQFPEKLIPVVVLKCLRGENIPVYGKGRNARDWLFVEDHCEALFAVMRRGRVGETYNIGGGNERRNVDLVGLVCDILDELMPKKSSYRELISFVEDRPGHDLRYAIDHSKIVEELGWMPKVSFEVGLRQTVKWYLENRNWWEGILDGQSLGN